MRNKNFLKYEDFIEARTELEKSAFGYTGLELVYNPMIPNDKVIKIDNKLHMNFESYFLILARYFSFDEALNCCIDIKKKELYYSINNRAWDAKEKIREKTRDLIYQSDMALYYQEQKHDRIFFGNGTWYAKMVNMLYKRPWYV